jgi:hypothetical protein
MSDHRTWGNPGFGDFDDSDRRSRDHEDQDVRAFDRQTGDVIRCTCCGELFTSQGNGEYTCKPCR